MNAVSNARADAAAVAHWLSRSPGYVRSLVRAGLLTPVAVETPPRGRPRQLFDLHQVARLVEDTPNVRRGG